MEKNSAEQLEIFLTSVDGDFPIPISKKQELGAYARKLHDKATLCAAYDGSKIIALVAGYTDNLCNEMAYISLVATLPQVRGRGLATELIKDFISICEEKKIKAAHLYAVPTNTSAIHMYRRLGFQKYDLSDEPRPDDTHLIYYLEEKNK